MIVSEITDILRSFQPVKLDEMNHTRLMDRIDSITDHRLPLSLRNVMSI